MANGIENLKVKQLKAELQKRGLDKKGVKEVLILRLKKAIAEEDENKADVPLRENKPVNDGDDTNEDLLLKILQEVSCVSNRLRKLEETFSNQLSFLSDHVTSQNSEIRHLKDDKKSLETISKELSGKLTEKLQAQQAETYVATIPTSNQFDVLEDKQKLQAPEAPADTTSKLTIDEQLLEYRERRRVDVAQQSSKVPYDAVVAGDSMVRHIDGRRLSRRKRVSCLVNPGAKAEHLSATAVCGDLKNGGDAIIHAGTNNNVESPQSVRVKIESLGDAISSKGRRACLSSVIHRRWETEYERRRVDSLNLALKTTAEERGWGYIDNANVGERHLADDGVHLNRSGQSVFAGNLSRYVNRHQRYQRSLQDDGSTNRRQDEWAKQRGVTASAQQRRYSDVAAGRQVLDFTQDHRNSISRTDPVQWHKYLQFVRRAMGNR